MENLRKIFTVSLLFVFVSACVWSIGASKKADLLFKAHTENELIPVLSLQYPDLDIKTAYCIQKDYVEKRLGNEKIAGFKAGITSEASQEKFNLTQPVAGVLFESGKKDDGAVIYQSEFKKLMMETEIGFLTGKAITEPITDIDVLKDSIQAVVPVVELPDLGFADKNLTGADIIAANSAASQFIVGPGKSVDDVDVNDIIVFLNSEEAKINQGKGSDALGDQWRAAMWLVNNMINQGYNIEPGNILITGALGNIVPGNIGSYTAYYGNLGQISFEIRSGE
jgi:2-keto-4-pentenoate hydratase